MGLFNFMESISDSVYCANERAATERFVRNSEREFASTPKSQRQQQKQQVKGTDQQDLQELKQMLQKLPPEAQQQVMQYLPPEIQQQLQQQPQDQLVQEILDKYLLQIIEAVSVLLDTDKLKQIKTADPYQYLMQLKSCIKQDVKLTDAIDQVSILFAPSTTGSSTKEESEPPLSDTKFKI